jgi:hypothetical protein
VKATSRETGLTGVTKTYLPTKLKLKPGHTTPASDDVPEENHPDDHDSDQWMAVSFLLIGSLATVCIFGILVYLRKSRQ